MVGAGIAKDYKEETEPNLHVKTFFLETFDEEKGSWVKSSFVAFRNTYSSRFRKLKIRIDMWGSPKGWTKIWLCAYYVIILPSH